MTMILEATAGEDPTQADIDEARRLSEFATDTLPRIRAAAEKWRNGLGVSAILAGALGYFVSRADSISSMSDGTRIWLGVAFSLLVAGTVISLVCSLRASIGWPSRLIPTRTDSLRAWEAKEVKRSTYLMTVSVWSAAVGIVAAGVSLSIIVFATSSPAIQVTMDDGRVICGSTVEDSGPFVVLTTSHVGISLSREKVASITAVASCP